MSSPASSSQSYVFRAKYALAITNEFIDTFRPKIMFGYDIGCIFSATAYNSPLVGPKLPESGNRYCMGSFHGHTHNWWCQLNWHPLYNPGCGLEDFKTCEHVFSCSNRLAACTWHASPFHRRQLISWWLNCQNQDKYAECSKWIYLLWYLLIHQQTQQVSFCMTTTYRH